MKRKSIVISSLALMVSIGLMIFGVYSAGVASLSVTGQVSYSVTDAKILVQGKINGAKGFENTDYPMSDSDDYTKSTKVNTSTQFLGFTTGGGIGNAADDLGTWQIGDLQFDETLSGINDIIISFKFTNFSPYPVTACLDNVDSGDNYLETELNLLRTMDKITVDLAAYNGIQQPEETSITYTVKSDGTSIDFNMALYITFVQSSTMVGATTNSISDINSYNGKIEFGDYKGTDVLWKCFAYSEDNGSTFTGCYDQTIPATATNCYFVLETVIPDFMGHCFLESENFSYGASFTGYLNTKQDITNLTGSNLLKFAYAAKANDYYYSDVREKIRNYDSSLMSLINIDTESEIYTAIQTRTIKELYKNNATSISYAISNYTPLNIETSEKDTFWLLSFKELGLIASGGGNSAVRWGIVKENSHSYITRTGVVNSSDESATKVIVTVAGDQPQFRYVDYSQLAVRVAFEMSVA